MKSWLKFLPKLVPKRTQERCVGYILLCTISHLRPFLSVWRRLELVCVVAFYYVVRAMARVHLFLPHVACVASVSSRGPSRKLGQEQKKKLMTGEGEGNEPFFCFRSNFRVITRLETLATQAIPHVTSCHRVCTGHEKPGKS